MTDTPPIDTNRQAVAGNNGRIWVLRPARVLTYTEALTHAQALALHALRVHPISYSRRCIEDGHWWPCPTALALNPEIEDE
jgi:hypothetical protein